MTKEEREKAIDLLDNLLGMVEDNQDNDYDKALKMGIESLRKEPSEDAVSRKAIVEMLITRMIGSVITFDHFIELLYKLPSVEPTQKWIPCSERLPEERKAVLVYCPERKNIYCACYENEQWWIFGAYFKKIEFEVVAWQPLPKPYKEMENERLLSYADQDTMQPAT